MMSAVEYAEQLGIRSAWSRHAIWDGEGINHDLKSVASIRFGPFINETVAIHTTNVLFQRPEDGEIRTIPEQDLEWYELQTKTSLPEDDTLYHLMAFTRIDVDVAGTQISVADFFNQRKDLQQGLHRDLSTLLFKNRTPIFTLPANAKRSATNGRSNRYFNLEPLAKTWRLNNVSSKIASGFSPNGSKRILYGGTGSPEKLNSLFFGQLSPAGQTFGNWICFMPIELFEQTYLTWLDDITGPVFKHHLEHCGLRIRKPNS